MKAWEPSWGSAEGREGKEGKWELWLRLSVIVLSLAVVGWRGREAFYGRFRLDPVDEGFLHARHDSS